MKRTIALFSFLLCCILSFSFAGCSSSKPAGNQQAQTQEQTDVKEASTETQQEEAAEPAGSVEGGKQYQAVIDVDGYGPITLILDEGIAPITVDNFVNLANEGFYNGLKFHRIMDGFMIQGGASTTKDAANIKGEFAANGFNNTLSHKKGVISMARASNPNSASSQFFICDEDSTFLDGQYAAFGWVTDGMDVVQKIADDAKPVDDNGTIPEDEQPVINSVTVTELGK